MYKVFRLLFYEYSHSAQTTNERNKKYGRGLIFGKLPTLQFYQYCAETPDVRSPLSTLQVILIIAVAKMPIHLAAQFVKRGTATKGVLDVEPTTTIEQLRKNVEHMFHVHPYQQGLLLSTGAKGPDGKEVSIKLDGRSRTLADFAADDRDGFDLSNPALVLTVKDYGRQVDYATVFVVEYLGPILIMMAYAARPSLLYGEGASKREWNWVAKWGVFAWLAHFVKRELETFFVHKFSNPTMPFFNIFKNSIYYWGFALVVGLPLCHPDYSAPANTQQVRSYSWSCAAVGLRRDACHVLIRCGPSNRHLEISASPGGPFALQRHSAHISAALASPDCISSLSSC